MTGLVTSTSSKTTVDYFIEIYGYLPTALSLYTFGDSPYTSNTIVPTMTVAEVGLNYILKLATELGISTPFDGTITNYVNLN